jgi:general secretion pathway protein G
MEICPKALPMRPFRPIFSPIPLRLASRGFSFLEIMLVVLIIGILVSIIGPNLLGKTGKARVKATKAQLKNVETALTTFEMEIGDLPSTDQGLEALVKRPSDVAEEDWSQYMPALPRDAWRQKFIYSCPGDEGRNFDLFSMGKDKKEGTDDDIWLYSRDGDDADFE